MNISLFKNIGEVKKSDTIAITDFINNCRFGKWKKEADKIRSIADKKTRTKEKGKILPYVTICGTFTYRNIAGIKDASGFICMDYDGVPDVEDKFKLLAADPYTYALIRSVSGLGFFWIVRIDPLHHAESFLALEDYSLKNYGVIADPSGKNLDRARFVSYDPDLIYNEKGKLFKNYLPKKAVKKLPEIVFGRSDVDFVLQQIQDRKVDLTQSAYDRYLKLGFALFAEYGEAGREYFHRLAQNSEKYSPEGADKQFNYIGRSNRTGITMATFFYYAKEAGLQIRTRQTQEIAAVAIQAKKGNRTPESAIQLLEEIHDLEPADTIEVVTRVFETASVSADDLEDLSGIEQLELFLHANYNLKRNKITRFVENYGKPLETPDLNTIYIRAIKEVDSKLAFEKLERLINSDFTPSYNPVLDWFDTRRGRNEKGLITRLAATISSDTGKDTGYVEYFITKWLVGVIASAHGEHSVLLLALTGGQSLGKTEWFRRLLPKELYADYFAESKLDAGKDDAILMTQKLIILDDEMSGKSKQESKVLKELTSKQFFTLREPYGKKNVTLRRLAVLCGTSNELGLLSDPTGNRRIIPINVINIDHAAYNNIDKSALLMEAYHLYQGGYEWRLNKKDVALLNENTAEFEQVRPEYELIAQFFSIPGPGEVGKEYLTATAIKDYIEENTNQKISIWKLGTELKAMGFKQKGAKLNRNSIRVYEVIVKSKEQEKAVLPQAQKDLFTPEADELPF